MINQCRACKHLVVYKGAYGECDDLSCNFFNNRAEMDLYEHCNFFEKISADKYVESNLACDQCEFNKKCSCIDVTNIYDDYDHYYDIKGNYCYLDNDPYGFLSEDDESDFD